jgi:hypothetical protein
MSIVRLIFCLAAGVLACAAASAQLRPDQKLLVEHLLSGMEPAMREGFRADFEKMAGAMNEKEVAAILTASGIDPNAPPPPQEESTDAVASREISAYHRSQYEPVYRASWAAQKAFDDLVTAELEARCADRHRYAIVMGPERYELPELAHTSLATWNVENDLKVLTGVAPQDGRYDFDFSKVRTRFDSAQVTAIVAEACAAWMELAADFHRQAQPFEQADNGQAIDQLLRTATGKLQPVVQRFEAGLKSAGPSNNEAFFLALGNGTPSAAR